MNIVVSISGTGTNLKALLDVKKENYLKSDTVVVASNKNAVGLDSTREFNVGASVSKDNEEIIKCLRLKNVNLIVLAGFLPKISKRIINELTIVNIHPSLLPKYGGEGCCGTYIHEKVSANKEKASGATAYLVSEELDDEDILLQKSVDISDRRSEDGIAKEVLRTEHGIPKDAIKKLEEDSYTR